MKFLGCKKDSFVILIFVVFEIIWNKKVVSKYIFVIVVKKLSFSYCIVMKSYKKRDIEKR